MSSVWDQCVRWWASVGGPGSNDAAARHTNPGGQGPLSFLAGKDVISIPGQTLQVDRVIAQGGFAVVLEASDVQDTSKKFALKKLLAHDKERLDLIKAEIKIMKRVCKGNTNQHIVRFFQAVSTNLDRLSARSPAEVLLQMEMCPGSVIDVVLSHEQGLKPTLIQDYFEQSADAVAFLHAQTPPIIHRDIKAENFLLTSGNVVKLCDFGSCTTQTIDPAALDYKGKMAASEKLEAMTTPQNRSPEMLDLFSEQPINEKLDVWALGCLLHVLCHRVHPFEDGATLAIVNVKYKVTSNPSYDPFNCIIAERLFLKDVAARASAEEARDAVASLDIA